MFSTNSIAGKFARVVFGPDQAVRKGWVEPRRAASDRQMGAKAKVHFARLAQESANTAKASRGAKAESAVPFNKSQGEAGASSVASTKPSGVERQPLLVSDIKLEDSQSSRSSRVGTRLCRSAHSVGDRLFSLMSKLLALSTVVGGAQASSDCGQFDSSKLKFGTFSSQVRNPDNYVGYMDSTLRSALDLFQNISMRYWDRNNTNGALLPTVSSADCASLPDGLPDPDGWDPSSWVHLESGDPNYQTAIDYAEALAYVICELITNSTSAILNINGTHVDNRFKGCSMSTVDAPPTTAPDSVGVSFDYTPTIMLLTMTLFGLIQNAILSYNAIKDAFNKMKKINNIGSKEIKTKFTRMNDNIKKFGEGKKPLALSVLFNTVLSGGAAMVANQYIIGDPIDWGNKPWETEAFQNMVAIGGAQLISEVIALLSNKCFYSGGAMVGKYNKHQLEKMDEQKDKRMEQLGDAYFNNDKTKSWVNTWILKDDKTVNPILKSGGRCENFKSLLKAMGPQIISLGSLVTFLQWQSIQSIKNDMQVLNDAPLDEEFSQSEESWVFTPGFKAVGVPLYVLGSLAVNHFFSQKCCGSSGSVRSSQALKSMNTLKVTVLDPECELPKNVNVENMSQSQI